MKMTHLTDRSHNLITFVCHSTGGLLILGHMLANCYVVSLVVCG